MDNLKVSETANNVTVKKIITTFSISQKAKALLTELKDDLGFSASVIVEIAIRKFYEDQIGKS
jgi:hypothetical protein